MNKRSRFHATVSCLWLVLAASVVQATDSRDEFTLDEALTQGARQFKQNDYENARRSYELATRLDPGSIRAWLGLGWSLWQLGQHDSAIKIWNDLAKVQPGNPRILLALAQAHEFRENWNEALTLYTQVLKRLPAHRPALVGRARVNLQLDQLQAAETDLLKVIGQEPSNFEAQFMLAQIYRDTDRQDDALSIYERLVAQPSPDPRYLRPMADMLLELGRCEEAIGYYQKNLKYNPDNRGTLLGLARCHAQLHQYDPAIAILESYLSKQPDDAKIREELARFSDYAGDFAKAEGHLRRLVREHPEEAKWQLSLAHVLQESGKGDESVAIARQVLANEPDNIPAMELMLDNATFNNERTEAIQWLERLAAVDKDVRRLNKLADAYLLLGDEHASNNQAAEARVAYDKSAAAFLKARETDPNNADALLGLAAALRLAGHYQEAIKAAQQALDEHPSVARARIELFRAWLALGNFDQAEKLLLSTLEVYPGNVRLRQELARVRFQKGDRQAAIADINGMLGESIRPSVPVLLYHGVSEASTRDAMPLKNFRDQMEMLKREGYRSISVHDLLDYYENRKELPPKPVMITFDDARSDSFRYADPVLRDTGFRATMFTPVAEVGRHGPYNAVWRTIREAYASGRWDIQCHSYQAHETVPLDAAGSTPGNFLTNRKWLAQENRLETREEFTARLDADYRECGSELLRQLPGLRLAGYAYPFGEAGQKFFSNEPEAFAINKELATKYYKVAFIQDPAAQVTRTTGAAVLPRFEVPANFTGEDLRKQLRSTNSYASTKLLLADLYSWDSQYAKANAILDEVAKSEEFDSTDLLVRRGNVAMWRGDFTAARGYYSTAASETPDNRAVQDGLARLDQRIRPSAWAETVAASDNQERSTRSVGAGLKQYLSDQLVLFTRFRHWRISNDNFDTRQLDPMFTGPADLRVSGNEVEAELEYHRDWRNIFSVTAGAAKFNDDSTAQPIGKPGTFPVLAAEWSFPAGQDADITLRAARDYVSAAGAILDDVASTSGEGRLQYRLPSDVLLDARYQHAGYSDDNGRDTGIVTLLKQVQKTPNVQIGYRFRYDDSQEQNPLYYTPNRFTGHDAVVKLSVEPATKLSFSLEGALGTGREGGHSSRQASILGTGRYQVSDDFGFYLNGGRSQSADYRSSQVTLGFSLLF